MSSPVVIALSDRDFDPTEVAVPWIALRQAGHEVLFATADGEPGACDADMLSGVLFGAIKATPANADRYREMEADEAFRKPICYRDISPTEHAALVLPGGHAPGMKQYLEASDLQAAVVAFFAANATVAAICHGTVVLARSVDPERGKAVIEGRKLTCLPKTMEWSAWIATVATRGNYFRTYPVWVQQEVIAAAGSRKLVSTGPLIPSYGKPYTVRDGNLLTARWPGDAERFAHELVAMLAEDAAAG